MNDLVAGKQNEIAALCIRHRVVRLQLFGSGAKQTSERDISDLDFLVDFQTPISPAEHADCFFGLHADLEQLFGRPVDLVEPQTIRNPYLLESINKSRVPIYAAA